VGILCRLWPFTQPCLSDHVLTITYKSHFLAEYNCKWDSKENRPKSISNPLLFDSPFQSTQLELFDIGRDLSPIELKEPLLSPKKKTPVGEQLKLYFGPELVA
jgi:hypothetical protein